MSLPLQRLALELPECLAIPRSHRILRLLPRARFSLERVVLLGAALALAGLGGITFAVLEWARASFGDMDYASIMRLLIPSVTALATGVQLVMAGFLSNVLELCARRD